MHQYMPSSEGAGIMTPCQNCKDTEANIFTATGDYCVDCWQLITETAS
jgi:hypothetical protein